MKRPHNIIYLPLQIDVLRKNKVLHLFTINETQMKHLVPLNRNWLDEYLRKEIGMM